MIRKKLVVILFVAILSFSFAPQKAEALQLGGLIDMFCWSGSAPGGATAPDPTVGCTLLWGPGSIGLVVDWTVIFGCLTSGCIIVNNPPPFISSIVDPEYGTKFKYIHANCLGQPAQVTVDSFAVAIRSGGIVVQDITKAHGLLVPVFCPGSSGAISKSQ